MARKIGRNDPCPCGSGKKYKNCCGAAGELNIEKLLAGAVKKSDLPMEDFVLDRLSEDAAFLRDAVQFILGPSGYEFCQKFGPGLDRAYMDDGLKDFVENDGMQVFASQSRNSRLDIREVRGYEGTVPEEECDIVSLYRAGYIDRDGRQVELFHRYLMENLIRRFDDYLYVPSEKAVYGQELGSFARRGYDFLLGITLFLELQLGVHAYFGLVNRWELPDGGRAIKDLFEIKDIPLTDNLDTGLGLMLAGYIDVIDSASRKYDAERELELLHRAGAFSEKVYLNRRDMIRSDHYSALQTYDYVSYLRLLVPAVCFNLGSLYGKASLCFPQCDLVKYLCGLEEAIRLFEDRAQEVTVDSIAPLDEERAEKLRNGEAVSLDFRKITLSRKDIYHNTVFWFMDEMNGMVCPSRPADLVYEDFAGINEDEFTEKDREHNINPARKSTYAYSMRKLRMEIYDAFNGKNFTLRIGKEPGSLEGLRFVGSYPILPWIGSGRENAYHVTPFDWQEKPWEDLYSKDITKRQEYLNIEYRLTTIPVNCIGLYLNPDVFYGWEERNQLVKLTRKQNAELKVVNEDLKKHIRLNQELVAGLSHSSSNYLDPDKLAHTGLKLHDADDGSPSVDQLHSEGLSLMLQSEQEMFLTRQLNSLVWRCSADSGYLKQNLRSGLSKTEGCDISEPLEFALRTIMARVIFRDVDRRAGFIRSKMGKTEEEFTLMKSSFMTDILSGRGASITDWWNENVCSLEISRSPVWEGLHIVKDMAFYDLIVEIITEQVFNALSHGDISRGIAITFGQSEEFMGVPRWAFIECVNSCGESYEGGTHAGIPTLSETVMLLNNRKKGIETSRQDDAFSMKVWLLASLLKAI